MLALGFSFELTETVLELPFESILEFFTNVTKNPRALSFPRTTQ